MSNYEQIEGLALLNDLEAQPDGFLTGGMNMVKRGKVGMIRRPEYSPLDAVAGPAVSPKGAFPLEYFGQEGDIMALDNGVLYKGDRVDSYDQVTKSVTDARPTHAFLGEWGLFATGGRVLKYDGTKTPHPVGSKLIADMEPGESWANATSDTDNEISGTACRKIELTGATSVTATLTTSEKVVSELPLFTVYNANAADRAAIYENNTSDDIVFDSVSMDLASKGNLASGTITMRVQGITGPGEPDGTDLQVSSAVAIASIVVGSNTFALGGSVTVKPSQSVAIIYDVSTAMTGSGTQKATSGSSGFTRLTSVDGAGVPGDWSGGSNPMMFALHNGSVDIYTNYGDSSTIKIQVKSDDVSGINFAGDTYIRLKRDGSNYLHYDFVSADFKGDDIWQEITLVRGETGSDFTKTGTDSWLDILSDLTSVDIRMTSSATCNIFLDLFYLLHANAPSSSDKVCLPNQSIW